MSLVERQAYTLVQGKYIRNVIGSTEDTIPPGYSDWIDAWEDVTKQRGLKKRCCVCGREDGSRDFLGNRHRIIGGHVVLGGDADIAPNGASGKDQSQLQGKNRVFIAPICDVCNQNSLMLPLRENTLVIHLWNFLYNEWWEAVEIPPESGQFIGQCGNNIMTVEGARQEWKDMYQVYAAEGDHLELWDRNYLTISAASLPSMGTVFSGTSGFSAHAHSALQGASQQPRRQWPWNYGKDDFV